ncbi:MAG: amino acid permease [Spirochaetia bacterium]
MNKGKDAHLKKDLGTKEVFAISAGAMISSGIFVLPAVVFLKAGPLIILAYLLSAIFVVPALFAKAELSTAMPKSGGDYFFISRSFGALFGTFSGASAWFSLSLKSAFALIGIGVFLEPLVPIYSPYMVKIIAVTFTVLFTLLNIKGVKESGKAQVLMVAFLLATLTGFVAWGWASGQVELSRFQEAAPEGLGSILMVTGMIFVSYGGITKVASVAEEIREPGKSIPRGMFSAFIVVSLFYLLSLTVMVGVLTIPELENSLTPLSTAAETFAGRFGYVVLAFAAMLAFVTTANAGLMAASRSPMAMARDNLIPPGLSKVNEATGTPIGSIILTSLFMVACIVFLDLEGLVKVASTMKLILFATANLALIIMRKSKIVSYRPSYKAPLYPSIYIISIVIYILLIFQMGTLPLIMTGGFFILSLGWYFLYTKGKATNQSAFVHMVGDITNKEIVQDESEEDLTNELLWILMERDDIEEDRFDSIIRNTKAIDMHETCTREEFFTMISNVVAEKWNVDADMVSRKLHEREDQSSTLIYPGVAVPHAIPHIIVDGEGKFDIIPVRNKYGIIWNDDEDVVYTAFCLLGSKDERNFHLKALMSIAQILQDPLFNEQWMHARNEAELRSVLLLTKRRRK